MQPTIAAELIAARLARARWDVLAAAALAVIGVLLLLGRDG